MKSILADHISPESRLRKKSLASESQEQFLPSNIYPLDKLRKKPRQIKCPYCHNISWTVVRFSDSEKTDKIRAILLATLADPFMLASWDWAQNIDHYCQACDAKVATKPYKGQMQGIPEEAGPQYPPRGLVEEEEPLEYRPGASGARGRKDPGLPGTASAAGGESSLLVGRGWESRPESSVTFDQVSILTEDHRPEAEEFLADGKTSRRP